MYHVGIDIGGNFHDLLLVGENGNAVIGKTLTTPGDPSLAVENALRPLLENGTIKAGDRGTLLHGTTLVTNALIERKGAPTALLTTRVRDAVEIGPRASLRAIRSESRAAEAAGAYAICALTFPSVSLLTAASCSRWTKPSCPDWSRSCAIKGIKAIAVSYLNSFLNSAHERRTAGVSQMVALTIRVSLGSEVVLRSASFSARARPWRMSTSKSGWPITWRSCSSDWTASALWGASSSCCPAAA